ncbi:MAG TPA: LssY C-terminal domain-containing protein [Candidatus Binataceae bacterium]|nr:LssY C-terminal domain-containing protein [Candidatus Binataceae bacterium]
MKQISLIAVLALLTAFNLLGCASMTPANDSTPTFIRAAETKEKDNVRVAVAVLTEAESREYFERPLEPGGVQAIWLRVENRNSFPVWILPRFTDPDYFSALEVAYRNHSAFSNSFNQKVDAAFQKYAIPWRVVPGGTNTGFLFVNVSEGAKFVNVELWHSKGVIDVGFYLELPSGYFDYEKADFVALYQPSQIRDLTIDQLRQVLERLPCCTGNRRGAYGDPVNVILIGANDDIFSALARQGWDPTHALGAGAVRKTLQAFLLGYRYRYSPVSSLYLFDRRQDVTFQKARRTIHQRNHMRLWLSPYTYRGKPVWVGQISRDIGLRFTLRSPFLTTHKIDPQVDEARDYLVQDLLASESLQWLAYVKGVGPASPEAPRENLTGDAYFTDGLRAVAAVSSSRVPASEVNFVGWEALPNQ